MKAIAISQRVDINEVYGERRDALDQRWIKFILQCGFLPILIPNNLKATRLILQKTSLGGILLTGGNDLCLYGGNAPERDETELALLHYALEKKAPLFGVCRGMQLIQSHYGVTLRSMEGHVSERQIIQINGVPVEVNSYHQYGSKETVSSLDVFGVADDGIIKGIRGKNIPIAGIMWHPERITPFSPRDIAMFQQHFGGGY